MEPILISNPYRLSVKETANLFWSEVLRRFWYILLILGGLLLFNVISNIIRNPFPFNLIFPAILFLVLFYVRFRFLSKLKVNEALRRSSVLSLYGDRLEFNDDLGRQASCLFTDIAGMSTKKIGYVIHLKDKKSILVVPGCFKNEEDKRTFERVLKAI